MSALARGIVIASEGTDLIIRATAAEVQAFGRNSSVSVAPLAAPNGVFEWMEDRFLYDRQGRPVAFVEEVSVQHHQHYIDTTTMSDAMQRVFDAGRRSYSLRARGPV